MELINQSANIVQYMTTSSIELACRTYYANEQVMEPSADDFIRRLIYNKQEALLEHGFATVKFVTSRGIMNKLMEHSSALFTQESMLYCSYKGNMEFIKPVWLDNCEELTKQVFIWFLENAEKTYNDLLNNGWRAQDTLPTALKVEAVVTANYREWRNLFKLFVLGGPDKTCFQMKDLMAPLLMRFHRFLPPVFDDLV